MQVTLKNSDGVSVSLSFSYSNSAGHDPSARSYLFPLAYLLVGFLWFYPQHYPIPFWLNLVATSAVLIYVGSHLSLVMRDDTEVLDENGEPVYVYGEGETMKMEDAQKVRASVDATDTPLFSCTAKRCFVHHNCNAQPYNNP